MERVQLGQSGLSVSPIAFGTWQLSPRFWGEQSKEEAVAAMHRAHELGINFFDTAEAYGDGHAETVLGEAIGDLPRDELVVATKVFNHFNPDGSRYPDLSPEHIATRCEVGLGVMVYSPLHKGLLTGKYAGDESFDDFRQNHPDFQGERFRELCAKVRSLAPIAERNGLTIYQLVLAATLAHPAIHVAVCGIKTRAQIEAAAGAAGHTLSRQDIFAVRNAVGPGSPKVADASGSRK